MTPSVARVAIAGATGLVGRHLLDAICDDAASDDVVVFTRRPTHRAADPNVLEVALDASPPHALDAAFCALGTTIKAAGSQETFRAIDHALVLDFAARVKAAGARQFHVVSALGAGVDSSVFYNRVKGEMERDLRNLGFERLHIYQPSLLMGERSESRRAERAGIAVAKLLAPIIPAKWRGIGPATVARAMWSTARAERAAGAHVVSNAEMMQLGA